MFNAEVLNDNELVQRYVNGDHHSIEILINRHKNRVYSYILLIVKNQDLAEDIFQDTFIKVIRSLKYGRYTENGKFISWVLRISHNLIIDHFRKEKLNGTIPSSSCENDVFNSQKLSDENIEDQMVMEQILFEVKELIKELPEDQQQVIRMRHYMGLSFKEIAELTGVSINTALGRMRYALINLRKLIKEKNLTLTRI
jgi:RNA polymerase sigma-70 factor (ECF subfamily)